MKMYVTMKACCHDESDAFGKATRVDAVFDSKEKALERIKLLAEKESEAWRPEDYDEEDEYSWTIEGSIDDLTENEYRVWYDDENYMMYYIAEVEFNPKTEELKPGVHYGENPYDLDYVLWR